MASKDQKEATAAPATEGSWLVKPGTKPARKAASKVVAKPVAAKRQAAKAAPAKAAAASVAAVTKTADEVVAAVGTLAAKAAKTAEAATNKATEVVRTVRSTVSSNHSEEVTMQNTIENNVDKAQTVFNDMNERAQAQFDKNAKFAEEMTGFAKGNVEAMVESSKIAAKGLESIGQEAANFTRQSFEKATATMKEMGSVKSPADFFRLQSEFVREQFDAMIAQTSKNTEAMMKLAGDAAQPISSRYAVAVEKVKTAA